MARSGRIGRRLALALLLTALLPTLFAILIARSMVKSSSGRFFLPELGSRLDQSLGLYQELARAVKASMKASASAIAASGDLRAAAARKDGPGVKRVLEEEFPKYTGLVSLDVFDADGELLGHVDRGSAIDAAKENKLEVTRFLSGEPAPPDTAGKEQYEPEDPDLADAEAEPSQPKAAKLVAVFAADRARFEELDEMSQFVDSYKRIEQQREQIDEGYLYAFAAVLGITIIASVGLGTLMARGVSSRIGRLAEATKRVGAGDLTVRVAEDGSDEIADLAKGFNHMLGEVETSRARIEYLQRIGAWQEMARRLAHEIKNPLTPIQLAVQEVHRRFSGDDPQYRKLLDTTREIVEDEVGTLRRLVSEFSSFARLPQARLEPADLADFLREQRDRISVVEDEADGESFGDRGSVLPRGVELEFDLPDEPAQVLLDRQMFRRALINLVRNAGQAIHDAGRESGRIVVGVHRDGDWWQLEVEDDGPGIAAEMRESVFDPYVTTKTEGTGLGLAIVKKIVVEHGGTVAAEAGKLGGARIRVRLPRAGTAAARAALGARDGQPTSGPKDDAR